MNKKHLKSSTLIASLFISSISFSMNTLLFRGVQLISGGYCIGKGFKKAYDRDQLLNDVESFKDLIVPEHEPIHGFVAHEAKRLNIAKKPLYYASRWCASADELYVPYDFCQHLKLKKKLEEKLNERRSLPRFESYFSDTSHYLDDEIREYQNEINAYEISSNRCDTFDLMHEFGHQINKDCKKTTYAELIAPIIVQTVGSSVTYTANKFVGIRTPQTILQVLGRSSLAIGIIPLKIAVAYCGTSFYNRYHEWRADTYACKNADQKELERAYNRFQDHYIESNKAILEDPDQVLLENAKGIFENNKMVVGIVAKRLGSMNLRGDEDSAWLRIAQFIYDPKHPYGKYRAAMIKKYIQNPNEDHPEVKA